MFFEKLKSILEFYFNVFQLFLTEFHRVSKSKLVFTGDCGSLFAFSLKTNCLANVKLPGLQNGCNVFSIARRKLKNSSTFIHITHLFVINLYFHIQDAIPQFDFIIIFYIHCKNELLNTILGTHIPNLQGRYQGEQNIFIPPWHLT